MDAVYEDLSQIPETASSQQLQSGIVIIDNETGDIVAMAGGVGKKTGSLTLNRAAQSLLSPVRRSSPCRSTRRPSSSGSSRRNGL